MESFTDIEAPRERDTRVDWLRSVFELSEDALLICATTGRILEINRRGTQLLGMVAATEWAKSSVFDSVSGSTSKKIIECFQRGAGQPTTLSAVTLLSGNGYVRLIVDLQITPLDGGFWLIAIKDASRRWRMESHVQRLIAAVDSTTDLFFLTDADLKLTFVNAAFQNVTGHTIEDALGRTADFLRGPHEGAKIEAYLAQLQKGEDWSGELVNRRSDGELYPVEAVISPIHDRNGKFLGYVACERDLSLKKKLQDDLRRERNFACSIINSIDSAIYTLDRDYHVTHVNDNWKKFPPQHGWLHLKCPPATGDSFLTYISDPARALEIQVIFADVLRSGHAQHFQVGGPGKREWFVNIAPLKHENGVIGLIYVVSDQTKFHELQAQLYQAQKMETIGSLAAGVAHDFNNLLQVIRGNLALITQDSEGHALDQRFQHIEEASTRAADITDQLLSFSRVSDEKMIVFDFNKIIKEVAQLTARSMRGNISLRVEAAKHPLKVRMDANRAHQALLNLVVNAQDAMPDGGTLTLTSRLVSLPEKLTGKTKHAPGSPFVCWSVSDSGTGIPEEILNRIFDPFFTTKETGKGTGLGLAIVHSVVTQAGGCLEVTSELGKGTTFDVYLPLVDSDLTCELKKSEGTLKKGSGRILVVDDLDLVRDFTQNFLRSAGYDVFVAAQATEALEILDRENGAVDLMFTDFNMPGMDGLELIEEVSRRWPAIKFILASGYLDDLERERIVNECGARILKKPYNVREASNVIINVLRAPKVIPSGT